MRGTVVGRAGTAAVPHGKAAGAVGVVQTSESRPEPVGVWGSEGTDLKIGDAVQGVTRGVVVGGTG